MSSAKLTLTVKPPATALSTPTVNDRLPLSSDALASAMLSVAVSALVIVPVAVPPLTLAVEGSVGGRMQKAAWATLRQQAGAAGLPYSFKYFQQVEGDLLLPPGMKPVRVVVRLQPASGAAVEQSFAWADAIGEAQPGA